MILLKSFLPKIHPIENSNTSSFRTENDPYRNICFRFFFAASCGAALEEKKSRLWEESRFLGSFGERGAEQSTLGGERSIISPGSRAYDPAQWARLESALESQIRKFSRKEVEQTDPEIHPVQDHLVPMNNPPYPWTTRYPTPSGPPDGYVFHSLPVRNFRFKYAAPNSFLPSAPTLVSD